MSSPWRRYTLAVALSALAALCQWLLQPWLQERVPFVFFLPAVALAAALGGRGPGWLPLLAGLVSGVFWLAPVGQLEVSDAADRLALLLFAGGAVLLVEFGASVRRVAERATEAEERLVMAIQGTGIGVFDLDLASRTAYVSPALARAVNLPVSSTAMPLDEWLSHVPPELVAESRRTLLQKFRARSRGYERELRLEQAGSQPLWLLLRVHVVWVEDRAVRLRGACVDITERKMVESRLAQAQAELSQQVADLNRLHDLSSRLLDAHALPDQLQMILETLVQLHGAQQGLLSLVEPDGRGMLLQAACGVDETTRQALARRTVQDGACGRASRGGERVVIVDMDTDPACEPFRAFARAQGFRAVHATPLISQDGVVMGAITVHLAEPRAPSEREQALADICARKAAVFTERARAQAALEESQGRFLAVLESSAVPFALLVPVRDGGGEVVDFRWDYLNRAAGEALQIRPEDLLGRSLRDAPLGPTPGEQAFQAYVAVAQQRRPREFEMPSRVHGEDGWLHCIASPMREAVAVWFNDITDRKRHERVLREADRRKDEFLATLAHELRNPLAPIRQAALLATAPQATDAQKRWSHQVIDRQVRHMALLLDDLLDVSRITRGVLSLRRAPTELAAVVASAVETARPAIDAAGHHLAVDLPAAPVHFLADPLRVAQVLANLLTNAAKYTDRGGHIRLAGRQEGQEVVLQVSDDGIGIAESSLPEVFRMFSQLHAGGDRGSAGLGIGLALSKGLVELHGGTIQVHSAGHGQGSTFTVRLPVGAPGAPAAPSPSAATGAPVRPRRVLIADDNRDAADSLAALLRLEGHDTCLSFDGTEALQRWREFDPDVCLFDIGMPGRNGYELAREIRAQPGGERPVLIAITGWGQEADRQRAMASGFNHHLTKPVDPSQLAHLFG
ncbi:ATP-binding protein [Ideonella sp.]|uniref:ATP-binding protein n=1 Tax=Ideonella sp. TaxID=1929293 RepID=UPI0035AF170C